MKIEGFIGGYAMIAPKNCRMRNLHSVEIKCKFWLFNNRDRSRF